MPIDLSMFPGGDLIEKGLRDLSNKPKTEESLLVLAMGPRLRRLGFEVPEIFPDGEPYEHMLYSMIEERKERGAHAAYNALRRRMFSFTDIYATHVRRYPESRHRS